MGKVGEWFPQLDNVYIPPTPHDGGLPIGAAQYVWHQILDNPRIKWDPNPTPYLGVTYTKDEVLSALDRDDVKVEEVNDDIVLDLLDKQNIISIFNLISFAETNISFFQLFIFWLLILIGITEFLVCGLILGCQFYKLQSIFVIVQALLLFLATMCYFWHMGGRGLPRGRRCWRGAVRCPPRGRHGRGNPPPAGRWRRQWMGI